MLRIHLEDGAEAGGLAGAAVVACAGVPGISDWGSVARLAAAGSAGKYSAPGWPQAVIPAIQVARTIALTRIDFVCNITKL